VIEVTYKEDKHYLYFDLDTKLLVKTKTIAGVEKQFVMEDFYDDYREFGNNYKVASVITTYHDGVLYRKAQITEIVPLVRPDPKLFSAPD
jgi:hypothetical protein